MSTLVKLMEPGTSACLDNNKKMTPSTQFMAQDNLTQSDEEHTTPLQSTSLMKLVVRR